MHPDEKAIHDLIGAIYDGAADPALWERALVQMSDAMRSVGAMLLSIDLVHPQQSRYVLSRLDPGLTQLFFSRQGDSRWAQGANRCLPGTTFATDAFVPVRELVKTEFYSDVLQPQQILHSGGVLLARDDKRVLGFSVMRTPKIGPVDAEDLRLLSLVAPHFKRGAQIAWRLGTLGALDAAKNPQHQGGGLSGRPRHCESPRPGRIDLDRRIAIDRARTCKMRSRQEFVSYMSDIREIFETRGLLSDNAGP